MPLKSTKSSKNWALTRETHSSSESSTNSKRPIKPSSSKNSLKSPLDQSVKSEPRMVSEEFSPFSIRTRMGTLISSNSRLHLSQFKSTWTTTTFWKWCTQLSSTERLHQTNLSLSTNSTASLPSTTKANEPGVVDLFLMYFNAFFNFGSFMSGELSDFLKGPRICDMKNKEYVIK